MRRTLRIFLSLALLAGTGCSSKKSKDHYQASRERPLLSLVKPLTQMDLNNIPKAMYAIRVINKDGEEGIFKFEVPFNVAIGGDIGNRTGAYENASVGQVTYTSALGSDTPKYYESSVARAGYVLINRNPMVGEDIRKYLMEVSGHPAVPGTNILADLTPLDPNSVKRNINNRLALAEIWVTGSVMEITQAEASRAAGINFAGIGASGKEVSSSITASFNLVDPHSREQLITKVGYDVVTARQKGVEGFRIVSWFGLEEYLNIEIASAKDLIKERAQTEVVDYVCAQSFTSLIEEKPEFLVDRLLYRRGKIHHDGIVFAESQGYQVVLDDRKSPFVFPLFSDKQKENLKKTTKGIEILRMISIVSGETTLE